MEEAIRLRDVAEQDLAVFFEQQLDPDANRMAAFTPEAPTDRDAFTARWTRILDDAAIAKQTVLCNSRVPGCILCFVAPWSGEREVSYWFGREY